LAIHKEKGYVAARPHLKQVVDKFQRTRAAGRAGLELAAIELYEEALQLINKKQPFSAELRLRRLLEQFPNTQITGDARKLQKKLEGK
jgi:outer membrane protein assembly factor BamD (BamD/ComL family)